MMVVGSVLLTGCVETMPHPEPARPVVCNAERAAFAMGRVAKPGLVSRAKHAARARDVRVIRPGQAVTMDFRQDRLNIEVDGRDLVRSVRCG
jgi:hypothetical protein